MAEKKPKHIINLLPNKADHILNDFLSWSLTIGRLLVILTETLALCVFLYRFTLDRQIIDLHGEIKTDSLIVANFKGEDTYRNLQKRLEQARDYDSIQGKELTLLHEIIELGRGKVTFKNIAITNDKIGIIVQAPSANILSVFTHDLKNTPNITGVSVDLVENRTSNGVVTVSLTATYN